MVEDDSEGIKARFQAIIDLTQHKQLEEIRTQMMETRQAKERYLTVYESLKQLENELDELTKFGKEESVDLTSHKYKLEMEISEHKKELDKLKYAVDAKKKQLANVLQRHKDDLATVKKQLFDELERERARVEREKAVMG
jgi:chromosome segregation ATPase